MDRDNEGLPDQVPDNQESNPGENTHGGHCDTFYDYRHPFTPTDHPKGDFEIDWNRPEARAYRLRVFYGPQWQKYREEISIMEAVNNLAIGIWGVITPGSHGFEINFDDALKICNAVKDPKKAKRLAIASFLVSDRTDAQEFIRSIEFPPEDVKSENFATTLLLRVYELYCSLDRLPTKKELREDLQKTHDLSSFPRERDEMKKCFRRALMTTGLRGLPEHQRNST